MIDRDGKHVAIQEIQPDRGIFRMASSGRDQHTMDIGGDREVMAGDGGLRMDSRRDTNEDDPLELSLDLSDCSHEVGAEKNDVFVHTHGGCARDESAVRVNKRSIYRYEHHVGSEQVFADKDISFIKLLCFEFLRRPTDHASRNSYNSGS